MGWCLVSEVSECVHVCVLPAEAWTWARRLRELIRGRCTADVLACRSFTMARSEAGGLRACHQSRAPPYCMRIYLVALAPIAHCPSPIAHRAHRLSTLRSSLPLPRPLLPSSRRHARLEPPPIVAPAPRESERVSIADDGCSCFDGALPSSSCRPANASLLATLRSAKPRAPTGRPCCDRALRLSIPGRAVGQETGAPLMATA
jgi:hypothetical protein